MSIFIKQGITEEGIQYETIETETIYTIENKKQHQQLFDKLNKKIAEDIKKETGDDVEVKHFTIQPDTEYPTVVDTDFERDFLCVVDEYIEQKGHQTEFANERTKLTEKEKKSKKKGKDDYGRD